MDTRDHRWAKLFSAMLFVSLILRAYLTWIRSLNADEFQHLHNSWMIHLGFLPYRDFWDNHTPLLHFFLAPLLGGIREGEIAVLAARALLSSLALAVLWITYKIGRDLLDPLTALIAVTVLSLSDIFLQKTIEVRPDALLAFFWLVSVWFCLRSRPRFFIAGVFLGVAALFSPKALLCLAAFAMAVLFRGGVRSLRQSVTDLILYSVGFLLPVFAILIFFYIEGALQPFISFTFVENLRYPDRRKPTFLLYPQNVFLLLLSFSGMLLWFRKQGVRNSVSLLWLMALVLFLLVAFMMPAPFPQTSLIFLPIFSIAAAFAIRASLQSSRGSVRFLVLMIALVTPLISSSFSFRNSNQDQFHRMNYVLRNTRQNDAVFDGNAAYIFRPQAYFYGSLVEGIRVRIASGVVDQSIIGALQKTGCTVVLYDDRVSDLPSGTQDFIRSNYIQTEHPEVYVAGQNLDAEQMTPNRAVFKIQIPAIYSIETNSASFRIDGRRYVRPSFLKQGIHEITSEQNLTYVSIRSH